MTWALNTSATWKISPRCAPPGAHLDEHQLPVQRGHVGELGDLDHVDQPVELLLDLLHHRVVAGAGQGDARDRGVGGDTRGDALQVVAAAREEPGNPGKDALLVFHEQGNDVLHANPLSSRSSGVHHLVDAGACRHHRPHVCFPLDLEVEEKRAVGGPERLPQRGIDLRGTGDADSLRAVCAGRASRNQARTAGNSRSAPRSPEGSRRSAPGTPPNSVGL